MISNKFLERLFQFFAAALAGAAAYFYFYGNYENVFVAAVFGSLCFFIGIRFQVKERLALRNEESKANELALEEEGESFVARDRFEKKVFEPDDLK